MTIGDLLEKLRVLLECNPGHITKDSQVVVSVGVLKGIVWRELQNDAKGIAQPFICFIDDATEVLVEEEWTEGETWAVAIHGGVDFELPPAL